MGDTDLLLLSHHLAVPVEVMYLQKEFKDQPELDTSENFSLLHF